jgi:hypothetical protein
LIAAFANWIHATSLGWALGGGIRWLEPACKTLHFVGLVLRVGCAGLYDLRLLGLGKGLPIGSLQRLVPYALLGFGINFATGVALFAGNPFQYTSNVTFGLKMLFILLAGVNALLFYVTGLHRAMVSIGPDGDAPFAAKLIAASSLFLWLGVIYWGRMLPYIGNAF